MTSVKLRWQIKNSRKQLGMNWVIQECFKEVVAEAAGKPLSPTSPVLGPSYPEDE